MLNSFPTRTRCTLFCCIANDRRRPNTIPFLYRPELKYDRTVHRPLQRHTQREGMATSHLRSPGHFCSAVKELHAVRLSADQSINIEFDRSIQISALGMLKWYRISYCILHSFPNLSLVFDGTAINRFPLGTDRLRGNRHVP